MRDVKLREGLGGLGSAHLGSQLVQRESMEGSLSSLMSTEGKNMELLVMMGSDSPWIRGHDVDAL